MSLADSDCQVLPDPNGGFDVYASLSLAYSGSSSAISVTIDKTEASTLVATDTKTFSSILLDGGSTDTLASLPTDVDLNVNNWTTLDLDRDSVSPNTVAVTDGSIVDGSVSATESYTLDNATISANLSGGSLTASDLVSLSGTDSLTGTVTVNGELDVAGSLSSGEGLTNNGTLNVNGSGTLSADVVDNGVFAFNISNTQTFARAISGAAA